jgi:hypothetical protein
VKEILEAFILRSDQNFASFFTPSLDPMFIPSSPSAHIESSLNSAVSFGDLLSEDNIELSSLPLVGLKMEKRHFQSRFDITAAFGGVLTIGVSARTSPQL